MASTLVRAASWLVVAVAVVLALHSVLGLLGPAGGRGAVVPLVGLVVQTVALWGIARGLRRMGERLEDRSGLSWEAEQFVEILGKRRAEVPLQRPRLADEYERLTDLELLDVYFRINAPAFPERFDALLWVIAQRAMALETRPAVAHAG